MKGWLVFLGAVFGVFGVWARSAGFVLFGLMLFVLGALAYVAQHARESLEEERQGGGP